MTGNKLNDDARTRIQTMVRTTDGFEIAEVDLALRGPGNVQGTEQSGRLEFRKADLIEHRNILKVSREEAKNIPVLEDRKSTRLNSSHVAISYAVFCLKKKKQERVKDRPMQNDSA